MYEAFFGMEHTPFVRDVPPEKLYESNAFRETLGRLSYVADRQMFAVVTADPGCGKSTLIRRFYSELPKEDYIVLYLSDSKLTPRWFYKGLLDQLGLESRFYRGDSKRQLQQEIEIIRGVQHKKVVIRNRHMTVYAILCYRQQNCKHQFPAVHRISHPVVLQIIKSDAVTEESLKLLPLHKLTLQLLKLFSYSPVPVLLRFLSLQGFLLLFSMH